MEKIVLCLNFLIESLQGKNTVDNIGPIHLATFLKNLKKDDICREEFLKKELEGKKGK